jgi:hypothetical protein
MADHANLAAVLGAGNEIVNDKGGSDASSPALPCP